MTVSSNTPDEICDFCIEDSEQLPPDLGEYSCIRSEWKDSGFCIWHAREQNKPIDELENSRGEAYERLDKAYLKGVRFGDSIDFSDCVLFDADFESAIIHGVSFNNAKAPMADFGEAEIYNADYTNADLRHAGFDSAIISSTIFNQADLGKVTAIGADIDSSIFNQTLLPEAKFTDSDLPGVDFTESTLPSADFSETKLTQAQFTGANLRRATFENSQLRDAVFDEVTAEGADFSSAVMVGWSACDANLANCNFLRANLERSTLLRAILFDANFDEAELYASISTDAQINSRTTFPDVDDREPDKAAWTYNMIERLAKENSLSRRGRKAYADSKDIRRRQFRRERKVGKWLYSSIINLIMRYGVSIKRVLITSLIIILVFGTLFSVSGGVRPNFVQSPPITYLSPHFEIGPPISTFLTNLYFSVVIFTTLGYGDYLPGSTLMRVLISLESFLGALLIALVVYVLGRRSEW